MSEMKTFYRVSGNTYLVHLQSNETVKNCMLAHTEKCTGFQLETSCSQLDRLMRQKFVLVMCVGYNYDKQEAF